MKKKHARSLAAAFVLVTAQAVSAESPSEDTLLLHVHATIVSGFFDFTSTVEWSIFRDGLVIERGSDSGNHCWIRRGAGTPEMLRELQEVLIRNRVGFQTGNCLIHEPIDNFSVEREVTWFGRANRQHTYSTGNVFSDLCASRAEEIDATIRFFTANAGGFETFFPCP